MKKKLFVVILCSLFFLSYDSISIKTEENNIVNLNIASETGDIYAVMTNISNCPYNDIIKQESIDNIATY